MRDPLDALILDLLEWIGPQTLPYAEVLEVWRTSCPRLPVWEEAQARGYITPSHAPSGMAQLRLSQAGLAHLRQQRPRAVARYAAPAG
jgi:hypothetical protein